MTASLAAGHPLPANKHLRCTVPHSNCKYELFALSSIIAACLHTYILTYIVALISLVVMGRVTTTHMHALMLSHSCTIHQVPLPNLHR